MMRALLTLAFLCTASGVDTATCAVNGAEAVDEMLDSAVFIMASLYRCEKNDKIRCALDVSSAIESVNGMVNVILKAVNNCGAIHTENHECGLAAGVLTRSFAGLSAGAAGIVARCPNKLNNGKALATIGATMNGAAKYGGHHASKAAGLSQGLGQCIINVKDVLKSLFQAIKRIMTLKDNCDKDPESVGCAHNSIKVLAGFTALGEYLAGAIGECSSNAAVGADALCAQMSLRLMHHTDNVGKAAAAMSKACKVEGAQRLYLENDEARTSPATSTSSVTLALAALLPITAVLSFVGGTRLAKARAQPARDCESLMELPEVE